MYYPNRILDFLSNNYNGRIPPSIYRCIRGYFDDISILIETAVFLMFHSVLKYNIEEWFCHCLFVRPDLFEGISVNELMEHQLNGQVFSLLTRKHEDVSISTGTSIEHRYLPLECPNYTSSGGEGIPMVEVDRCSAYTEPFFLDAPNDSTHFVRHGAIHVKDMNTSVRDSTGTVVEDIDDLNPVYSYEIVPQDSKLDPDIFDNYFYMEDLDNGLLRFSFDATSHTGPWPIKYTVKFKVTFDCGETPNQVFGGCYNPNPTTVNIVEGCRTCFGITFIPSVTFDITVTDPCQGDRANRPGEQVEYDIAHCDTGLIGPVEPGFDRMTYPGDLFPPDAVETFDILTDPSELTEVVRIGFGQNPNIPQSEVDFVFPGHLFSSEGVPVLESFGVWRLTRTAIDDFANERVEGSGTTFHGDAQMVPYVPFMLKAGADSFDYGVSDILADPVLSGEEITSYTHTHSVTFKKTQVEKRKVVVYDKAFDLRDSSTDYRFTLAANHYIDPRFLAFYPGAFPFFDWEEYDVPPPSGLGFGLTPQCKRYRDFPFWVRRIQGLETLFTPNTQSGTIPLWYLNLLSIEDVMKQTDDQGEAWIGIWDHDTVDGWFDPGESTTKLFVRCDFEENTGSCYYKRSNYMELDLVKAANRLGDQTVLNPWGNVNPTSLTSNKDGVLDPTLTEIPLSATDHILTATLEEIPGVVTTEVVTVQMAQTIEFGDTLPTYCTQTPVTFDAYSYFDSTLQEDYSSQWSMSWNPAQPTGMVLFDQVIPPGAHTVTYESTNDIGQVVSSSYNFTIVDCGGIQYYPRSIIHAGPETRLPTGSAWNKKLRGTANWSIANMARADGTYWLSEDDQVYEQTEYCIIEMDSEHEISDFTIWPKEDGYPVKLDIVTMPSGATSLDVTQLISHGVRTEQPVGSDPITHRLLDRPTTRFVGVRVLGPDKRLVNGYLTGRVGFDCVRAGYLPPVYEAVIASAIADQTFPSDQDITIVCEYRVDNISVVPTSASISSDIDGVLTPSFTYVGPLSPGVHTITYEGVYDGVTRSTSVTVTMEAPIPPVVYGGTYTLRNDLDGTSKYMWVKGAAAVSYDYLTTSRGISFRTPTSTNQTTDANEGLPVNIGDTISLVTFLTSGSKFISQKEDNNIIKSAVAGSSANTRQQWIISSGDGKVVGDAIEIGDNIILQNKRTTEGIQYIVNQSTNDIAKCGLGDHQWVVG